MRRLAGWVRSSEQALLVCWSTCLKLALQETAAATSLRGSNGPAAPGGEGPQIRDVAGCQTMRIAEKAKRPAEERAGSG